MDYQWDQEELVWVVKPEFADILHFHLPRCRICKLSLRGRRPNNLLSLKSIIHELRNENIQRTIILDYKTIPVLFYITLSLIIGIRYIDCDTFSVLKLFNKNFRLMDNYKLKHEVVRYRDLLSQSLPVWNGKTGIRFYFDESIDTFPETKKNIIVIAPGSARTAKRWSISKFMELSERFIKLGYSIIFVGGEDDKYLIPIIRDALPGEIIKILIGSISIVQAGEWIKKSRLLISNDSAMMHYADFLEKPVVAVFGITDPVRCGPFTQLDRCVTDSSFGEKYSLVVFRIINRICSLTTSQ